MAAIKTRTIFDERGQKAIVGIPGWAETLGQSGRSAADAVSAWASVPLLYRAVSLRASSISSVPFVLHRGEAEVEWPLAQDLPGILYALELGLLLTGAAYALKQRAANGRALMGLQVLNPTTVTWKVKDGDDVFTQRVGSHSYGPWGADEILAVREPSMTADRGPGLAPASVALSAAQLRFNLDDFAAQFFADGAMPQTLITTGSGNPGQAEIERAQSYFKRRMQGVRNAWRALVLRGDLTVQTITPELKSMALPDLNNHVCLSIGAALGIPRSILESDASSYATAVSDQTQFWTTTIRPRLPLYEQAINGQLFSGTDYRLAFTPENLDIFQEDEAERAASLLHLVQAGVPLGDAMLMLGYDPLENAPQPEPRAEEPEPEPGPEPEQMQAEMAAWQRYAVGRLGKNGKARPFRAQHIPGAVAGAIEGALQDAENADEVRDIFGGAWAWHGWP